MRRLLDAFAFPATRAPRGTLLALLAATLLFGGLATQLQVSTSLSEFAPEGGLAEALDDVDERYGAGASLQLIADTGPGGDLLTPEGLALGQDLQEALAADADLAPLLADDATDRPAVLTYAEPFVQAADALDTPLAEIDPETLELVVTGILDDGEAGAQVAALLSDDLVVDPPRARGGIGVVDLRPGLSEDERAEASDAVEAVLAEVSADGVRVSLLSDALIQRSLMDSIARDVPLLLGLSLLLTVLVLATLFRTVSDVVVGLSGLLVSIVWMVGLAALLGPSMLDLVGPFGQTAIAVPVLLVGLGVDYSVHLTTRYREQQRRGDTPVPAAITSLLTVGVALVLATAATVGGFLANLATPLPPIADLGVFAAIGIVCAFVVFSLAVPATRVLLDRRRDGIPAGAGVGAGRSRWTELLTRLTVRRPAAVLVLTGMLVAAAGVAASGLGTEFDEREFLPEGAAITSTIDRTDTLFGGDVGETTYVVADGHPDDPAFLAAVATYEDELTELDAVRRVGDRAQVTSPFELVDRLGLRGERVRTQLAGDLDTWQDPSSAADSLPDDFDPVALVEQFEDADADELDVPAELVDAVESRLPAGRSAAVALATTSDPEELRARIAEQLAADALADRPDGLDDAELAALAALPERELTLDRLTDGGYPVDELTAEDREALEVLEQLEAAGWSRDAPSRAPDDVAAQVAVAREVAGDELRSSLADDGVLLAVSTAAGEDGATALGAALDERGGDVEAAGGDLTVISQALVNAEIIDSLSAAQLVSITVSIAIAALILVVATFVSDRSFVLGLIGVAPAITALVLVLGTMQLIGLSFNALTATVASIAVGIGVPYGIHLTNRFRASLRSEPDVESAIRDTLRHTGGALAGSAVTTGLAFGVLVLGSSAPLQQFGLVSALMIGYALVACLVVQPTLLALWARRRVGRSASGDDERTAGSPPLAGAGTGR
ncbi:MMPL family transporter [Nitriliruptoraceae bacterium ZYF776]|nr:MMPL family transporter [Profundirhabdus halotolerans]